MTEHRHAWSSGDGTINMCQCGEDGCDLMIENQNRQEMRNRC